jgi:hypothetical protein
VKLNVIVPILVLAFIATEVSAQNQDSEKGSKSAPSSNKSDESVTKAGPRVSVDINEDNEKYGAVSTSPRADRLTADLMPCNDHVCNNHMVSSGPRDVGNCMLLENITLPACRQIRGTSSGSADENGNAGGK